MNREQIMNVVAAAVQEQMGNHDYEVKEADTFKEDLGLDSLDVIEVTIAVERKLNISLPDKEVAHMLHVRDLLCLVEQAVNNGHGKL